MTEKVGDFARAYWPIIIGLIALGTAWGTSTMQIAAIGETMKSYGDGQKTIITKVDSLAEKMATQQATTAFAMEQITDLKARLRDVEIRR